MVNFVDEYPRQLDERGRVILPAKVRESMSRSMSDKCLQIYTQDGWEKISDKIKQLPIATDRNAAAFARLFFGKASSAQIDKQGRVPISKRLTEFAGLEKDVVLVGANDHLEIWDSAEWERYQSELSDDIMIEGILNYGLNI